MQRFRTTILLSMFIFATILPLASLAAPPKPIALSHLALRYNLTSVSQTNKEIIWKTENSKILFFTGSRRIMFNDKLLWLNGPIYKTGKDWCISKEDAETVVTPLLQPENYLKNKIRNRVVLDPGHGGKDSGGIGCHNTYEKTVVLDIARRVRKRLKASGIKVYMTRNSDVFLELAQRPAIAKSKKADLFISIHANKASRVSASGIESFIMTAAGFASTTSSTADKKSYPGNRNDIANTILGNLIHSELITKSGATDRGVKHARFKVLKDATCPAVLIEAGFLTNPTESKNLITPAYRDKLADGITTGILNFLAR